MDAFYGDNHHHSKNGVYFTVNCHVSEQVETKTAIQLTNANIRISLDFETGFLLFETESLNFETSEGNSHHYETGFLNIETTSQHFETYCMV